MSRVQWEAPYWFRASQMAQAIRKVMDARDAKYAQDIERRFYSQIPILPFPVPRQSNVFVYEVKGPVQFTFETWEVKPHQAGIIGLLRVLYEDSDYALVRPWVEDLVDLFRKPPWKFPLRLRFQVGLFHPIFRKAPKDWAHWNMGPLRTGEPILETLKSAEE